MLCCGAGGDGGVVFPAGETYVQRFPDLRGRVGAAVKSLLGAGWGGAEREEKCPLWDPQCGTRCLEILRSLNCRVLLSPLRDQSSYTQ